MGALVYLIASPLFWALFILAAILGAAIHKFHLGRKKKPQIPTLRPPTGAKPPAQKPAPAPEYYPAYASKKKH